MHFKVVMRIVGSLLCCFCLTLVPPIVVSAIYNDGNMLPFVIAFLVTVTTGVICWAPVFSHRQELRIRDGFLIVVLFWTVLTSFGSLPFLLTEQVEIGITDAFFESMSGLTTTGATVLQGIDELPESLRYYRQQLQWLGGMGIIVLAVAVMPLLGIGGMQLYRAETPGPIKDSKLTPRIAETAKALWMIYIGLTAACALGYWVAGMTLFDAITHSFSTIAIGGFSTHDASLGYFHSAAVETVAMVFMVIAAINFALHFGAWRSRKLTHYLADAEVRAFLLVIFVAFLVTATVLGLSDSPASSPGFIRSSAFQVISIITTTGFTTEPFHLWPSFVPIMLIMLSTFGGCAGSTAGGMKVMRILLLYKQGRREIAKLIHPNAVIPIKMNGNAVPDSVVNAVWGFMALYIFSYAVLALAMTATGADPVTAFSSVSACLNNLGPGIGAVADNYTYMSTPGKWILSFAMLLGRLELFTLLVIFTRSYWQS